MVRRTRDFGLPQLDLPGVDLDRVMARVREVIETIQHHDSPERFGAALFVALRHRSC